jgi:flavin reductase (DIM6/NTAB) family NADH-FMN oxidoreductase RutF
MATLDRVILPCDSTGFRTFMSRWPTGVTVVTTSDRLGCSSRPVGCTVNAMMSVSLAPRLLVIALLTGSRTLDSIRDTHRFALNLLRSGHRHLCERFAAQGIADRFAGVAYHWHWGVPLLDAITTAVVCDVDRLIECGDHTLVVGAPVWHSMSNEDDPLVFYHRTFHGLATVPQPTEPEDLR